MKLSDNLYNILKWISITALPAINTCVAAILGATGVASETTAMIVTIISAVATLLGTLIGISTINYNATNTDENAEG